MMPILSSPCHDTSSRMHTHHDMITAGSHPWPPRAAAEAQDDVVELPEDLLRKVVKYLPPSLNVCLASKLCKAGRRPLSLTSRDVSIEWLWTETGKIRGDHEREKAQMLVIRGAAFRGACCSGNSLPV